jgi:hypothetical protein
VPPFDPQSHEALADAPWNEPRVREAIIRIVADAEDAYEEMNLWPAHPLDEDGVPLPALTSLYLGASGVIWALDVLARAGAAELRRDWAPVATTLYECYLRTPDFHEHGGGQEPSFWMGEAGILLVAHRFAPAAWQEERVLACVHENRANPTRELMWGSPGTMLAAQTMYERTGREAFADAWCSCADWLLGEWHEDLWLQQLYGNSVHILGPAHGFAGNIHVLCRGELLDPRRRVDVERRAVAVVARYARREDGLAQWPASLEPRPERAPGIRTQWCHGAPGIVASLAPLAPEEEEFTELLSAGGELTWRAGPLGKGPGLCHGTAGNGYAFLKLFERTRDETWLTRARAFAMHAIDQVERARRAHGRGRYTLWTGDLGTALYLWNCVSARASMPTLDG